MNDELYAPELSVVYLVPVQISDIYGNRIKFAKMMDRLRQSCQTYVQHCVPIEVENVSDLTDDMQIFYKSDIEYFENDYLKLKRFCRVDLKDKDLRLKIRGKSQIVHMRQYLTIFDIGIAVYIFWIEGLRDFRKSEIIDMSFIKKIEVDIGGNIQTNLVTIFQQEIRKVLKPYEELHSQDIIENHLCLLFVKDFPFTTSTNDSAVLPQAFIEKYKNEIFDIISLPDRYMGISYEFHKTRDPKFIDEVLVNMSVRNDFPVFLFSNRFLGIKINTGKPDYNFDKRIIFNIVLYTNITLQLLLLKHINKSLMDTVVKKSSVTLGKIVKLRHAAYRYLEEYINVSVQRYAIWKKAVKDASTQLGIPDLYEAVEERLSMLNNYLDTSLQSHSNVWFIMLNTIFFFSTVFSYFDYILGHGITIDEPFWMLVVAITWFTTVTTYYLRYIR